MRQILGALVAGFLAVWLFYQRIEALPAGLICGLLYLWQQCRQKRLMQKQELEDHFYGLLSSLQTSMLAGYALENALRNAAQEMEGLYGREDVLCRELREINRRMLYGADAGRSFCELGARSGVEAIRLFGEVIEIAGRTGGNLQKVLGNSWDSFHEKKEVESEIRAAVAAKVLEQQIMTCVPAGILLYMKLTFPGFLDPLYGNLRGVLIMTAALAIYLTAVIWGKRLVERGDGACRS